MELILLIPIGLQPTNGNLKTVLESVTRTMMEYMLTKQ